MSRASFQPTRESFIPKGSVKVTPKDIPVVIYLYESAGKPCAMVFGGKRNKPDLHVQYRTPERREQHLREHVENARKVAEYKAEQLAKRKGFKHGFKVGDVLYNSWGYEQTNVEFYEVIATTAGTLTMREIAQETEPGSEGFMCDRRKALPGQFLNDAKPVTKRVQYGGDGPGHISMDHGSCSLWDGKSKYCSWYA